jgi:hypothetical protein
MRSLCLIALLGCVVGCALPGRSYSVLTHEQIVDLAWQDQIRPLLLKRFPQATPDDIKQAHAYAYGGSVVQDMGYYPFGNKYFSDLVHYVRSGDFVSALIADSTNINEYAFALGALAHYSSDNTGHPAINQVVAIEFPKLRKKYGNEVTYADDHKAHIRTEFGFDMVQVAKNRYTSDRYHDFIGFEVSKPVLERAFVQTYGLQLKDVLGKEDMSIGTFRRAISKIIPEMTRVALLNRRADLVPDTPNSDKRKFLYHLSRANYEKQWGRGYRRPGFGSRLLAFILRVIPKIGPASALAFKVPTTKTEDIYIKSVNQTTDNYYSLLHKVRDDGMDFSDTDCDTGRKTAAAEYPLADVTYSKLLQDQSKKQFALMTPELRSNILEFYSNLTAPYHDKKNRKSWKKTMLALQQLKNWQPPPVQNLPVPIGTD